MDWRHPSLPPLLRGLGTSVLLLVSAAVGVVEHRQSAQLRSEVQAAHARIETAAARAGSQGTAALTREIELLRLQLREGDLAGEVFENPWFQAFGALGTSLIALSFFVEARQKRPAPSPAA